MGAGTARRISSGSSTASRSVASAAGGGHPADAHLGDGRVGFGDWCHGASSSPAYGHSGEVQRAGPERKAAPAGFKYYGGEQTARNSPRSSVMDRRTWHVILPIVAALILVWLAQLRRGADSPLHRGRVSIWPSATRAASPNDLGQPDNYLLEKPHYALSYNNAAGTPNWVAWRLEYDDIGGAPRSQFYPDPDLPRFFQHVVPHDYTETGFDRGHLCPHGDRTGSPAAAAATFAMTNMIPQAPSLNRKAWADFEIYCRDLVRRPP